MGSSYYKIEEPDDIEVQLNTVPRWLKRIALPLLILIIFGLPSVLFFIPYSNIEIVNVKVIPVNPSSIIESDGLMIDKKFLNGRTNVTSGELIGRNRAGDSIRSPLTGILHLNFDPNTPNLILVVEPVNTRFIIRGSVPLGSSSLIKVGQKVEIDLENYPGKEFGYIEGIVQGISESPTDNQYSIDIKAKNSLYTNKGIEIKSGTIMIGKGRIILLEKRILTRIIESISKVSG